LCTTNVIKANFGLRDSGKASFKSLKTIKTVTEEIKVTCLHDRHVAQGALMSPFAGYDMPIQYVDITTEHNAVRQKVGVFDVSHMGEVEITGPDAAKFTNYIFTNDINAIKAGQILYGMMLYPTVAP
jgi:aminomethyltransferase